MLITYSLASKMLETMEYLGELYLGITATDPLATVL